jgi:hypothetical protein
MRYLILASVLLIVGYVAGALSGYRAAVTDYVENDARTIREVADTMYDTASGDDIPDEVKKAVEQSSEEDNSRDENGAAFQ